MKNPEKKFCTSQETGRGNTSLFRNRSELYCFNIKQVFMLFFLFVCGFWKAQWKWNISKRTLLSYWHRFLKSKVLTEYSSYAHVWSEAIVLSLSACLFMVRERGMKSTTVRTSVCSIYICTYELSMLCCVHSKYAYA